MENNLTRNQNIGILIAIIITLAWVLSYLFKYSSDNDWYFLPTILTSIAIPFFFIISPNLFNDGEVFTISLSDSAITFGILMEHIWAFAYLYTIVTRFVDWTQIPIILTIILINIYTWFYLLSTRKNNEGLIGNILLDLLFYGLALLGVGVSIMIFSLNMAMGEC